MLYTVKNGRIRRDGEVIAPGGTVEMPKEEAGPLVERGLLEKAEVEPQGPDAMNVPQLKEALEEMGVEIPKGARRDDLVALYEQPPNAEG